MKVPGIELDDFKVHTDIEVRFRDLDAFGHVNNAVFATYLEIARTEYWRQVANAKKARDFGFILARVEIDYVQPIPMFATVRALIRVSEMRSSSFFFHYALASPDGKTVYGAARTVQVMFDYAAGTKISIPDPLRKKISEFEELGL